MGETCTPRVFLKSLMLEAAREMKSYPMALGFQMAENSLQQMAKRSVELNDDKLISLLYGIGYLEIPHAQDLGPQVEIKRVEV